MKSLIALDPMSKSKLSASKQTSLTVSDGLNSPGNQFSCLKC